MDIFDKLKILTDAAKYDVACTSSGIDKSSGGKIGNSLSCGICHSFSSDGRCISLLKVLMSNSCIYNCAYCANKASNDIPRATFTPRELADLTINFYKRNYIEGLFLSSGIIRNPDYTCERMIETVRILRTEYGFNGYIHAKGIPGANSQLIYELGLLVDRMSVNIELPSRQSLERLAPDKSKVSILKPMGLISDKIQENSTDIIKYNHAPKFAPAGQSTQIIVGATDETDYKILNLTEALYKKYNLKRVFYSAYVPINSNPLLPTLNTKPPLLREHRLYQADWLLRYYGFSANELLDNEHQSFNPLIDPKCNWAINHMEFFPVEINKAPKELLLRVPGIGVKSALRILSARKYSSLDFSDLKKIGVILKRAQYFITCKGKAPYGLKINPDSALNALISDETKKMFNLHSDYEQLNLFTIQPSLEEKISCLKGQI